MNYRILPPEGWMEATVTLPLSKSLSARSLIINYLAGDMDAAGEVAECDDTDALRKALAADGAAEICIGGAGTAMRFLTACFAAMPGRTVTIDGDERMRHRPVRELVEALRKLGADVEYSGEEGFPPLKITGRRLKGGSVEIDASISSQFVSALMMAAPLMENGLKIELKGETVSLPYLLMTLGMMRMAGIKAEFYGGDTIEIAPGTYSPHTFEPEGDWSAAAAWYAIELLTAGEVTLTNVRADSLQGDRHVAEVYNKIGVVTDFEPEEAEGTLLSVHPDGDARLDMDFAPMPDLVPAVAVSCGILGIPFHFTGLKSLAIKECDRVTAIATELLKIGVAVERPAAGEMMWDGRRMPVTELPRFATYGDHRMAMAFAPVAVFVPGIVVEDAEVVSKSYPGFWKALTEAGFTLLDGDAPLPEPTDQAED